MPFGARHLQLCMVHKILNGRTQIYLNDHFKKPFHEDNTRGCQANLAQNGYRTTTGPLLSIYGMEQASPRH